MILFSIIIPTYNRAHLIAKAIESVLQQSYGHFEVIIVDDGSTDPTAEVVKGYSDTRIQYYKKENGERGAARNYGTRIAKGNYVNFFDSDDQMYPNHLSAALEVIATYGEPEVLHVNYELRDANGVLLRPARIFKGDTADALIVSNDLACNSVFVRRDVALANPFHEDRILASAEDWELWLRLATLYPFYYTNTVTYAQIAHQGRSLTEIEPDRIIERDEYLLKVLLANEKFVQKYQKHIPRFIAERYTFITLHLALSKRRRVDTIRYLCKAVGADLSVVTTRRFLASVKHWI